MLSDRQLGYLVLAGGVAAFLLLHSIVRYVSPPAPPVPHVDTPAAAPVQPPPSAPREVYEQAGKYFQDLERRGFLEVHHFPDQVTIIYVEPKFWTVLSHKEKEGVTLMCALHLQELSRQRPDILKFPYYSLLDMTSRRTLARGSIQDPADYRIIR